jgi:hypothetical protein
MPNFSFENTILVDKIKPFSLLARREKLSPFHRTSLPSSLYMGGSGMYLTLDTLSWFRVFSAPANIQILQIYIESYLFIL